MNFTVLGYFGDQPHPNPILPNLPRCDQCWDSFQKAGGGGGGGGCSIGYCINYFYRQL